MGNAFWLTAGDVIKNQVVELVLENTTNLLFRQASKEVWVVDHLKLSRVWVDHDSGSWDIILSPLLYLSTESRKEGLIHQ